MIYFKLSVEVRASPERDTNRTPKGDRSEEFGLFAKRLDFSNLLNYLNFGLSESVEGTLLKFKMFR